MKSSLRRTRLLRQVALSGFLVGVSVLGVTRTEQANRRLQGIIQEQDVKTGLVSAMFRIRRERSELMAQLFADQDPPVKMRLSGRYDALWTELTDVWGKLSAMPLSGEERRSLEQASTARPARTVRDRWASHHRGRRHQRATLFDAQAGALSTRSRKSLQMLEEAELDDGCRRAGRYATRSTSSHRVHGRWPAAAAIVACSSRARSGARIRAQARRTRAGA